MRLPVEPRLNRIRAAIKNRQQELGRKTTRQEDLEFFEATPDTLILRRVRLSVYENPNARIPLHQDLFKGPIDGRWGLEGGHISRVYIGSEAARLEELLGRPMLETQQSNTGASD